jgi:hypothetical protein
VDKQWTSSDQIPVFWLTEQEAGRWMLTYAAVANPHRKSLGRDMVGTIGPLPRKYPSVGGQGEISQVLI